STVDPWRLAAISYDGQRILAGGLSDRLLLLDGTGKTVRPFTLDAPPTAVALDPLGPVGFVPLPDNRVPALGLHTLAETRPCPPGARAARRPPTPPPSHSPLPPLLSYPRCSSLLAGVSLQYASPPVDLIRGAACVGAPRSATSRIAPARCERVIGRSETAGRP